MTLQHHSQCVHWSDEESGIFTGMMALERGVTFRATVRATFIKNAIYYNILGKMLLFLMLTAFNIFNAHCQKSDQALLKAIENALIEDNLINLQKIFYPPDLLEPKQVTVHFPSRCNFTVKRIISIPALDYPGFYNCSSDCGDDVFCYNGWQYYYDVDLYAFEDVKSSFDLASFITSDNFLKSLSSFDTLSTLYYLQLTQISHYYAENQRAINISLSVEKLDKMPKVDEVDRALGLLFSWVRYYQC